MASLRVSLATVLATFLAILRLAPLTAAAFSVSPVPFRILSQSASASVSASVPLRRISPRHTSTELLESDSPDSDSGIVPETVPSPDPAPPPLNGANPEGTSYPLNVPSPLLLASSMVLAIASVGSIFELSGGTPTYGLGPTAAIAAIGLPGCLFLFYAAILKGMAETEEDDKAFLNKR